MSFATRAFRPSQLRLVRSALAHGIDAALSYGPADIEGTDFWRHHRDILDNPQGAGNWLWKPFLIRETLRRLPDGDVLMYSDAGVEVVGDVGPLVALLADQRVALFRMPGMPNAAWTKRDAFILTKCDAEEFYYADQVVASFMLMSATSWTVDFVSEWLQWCCDSRMLTDQPNTCGKANHPDFIAHRHDQSLLSLLQVRYGLPTHRDPSQYGNHLKPSRYRVAGEFTPQPYVAESQAVSDYGTLLNHHRSKALSWDDRLRERVGRVLRIHERRS